MTLAFPAESQTAVGQRNPPPAVPRRGRGPQIISPGAGVRTAARRLRVAVLEFYERTPLDEKPGSLGREIATRLSAQLTKGGRFELADPEELEQVLGELRVRKGELINEPTALRIGRLAGLDYLIYGGVEKFQIERSRGETLTASVTASYKALSLETGRLWKERELSATVIGDRSEQASDVTGRAIQGTVNEFANLALPEPVGKVALVDADRKQFVINLGSANGVERGTYVQVIRWGKEVRDPDTDEVIERQREVVSWGRVVDTQPRSARVEAGTYSRSDLGVVRWKTRHQKLSELRVGDVVEVVEGRPVGFLR